MWAPARPATCCIVARLPPHSWRPVRMRSPGAQGPKAAKARPQASEQPDAKAISSGPAPTSRAARVRAASSVSRTACAASMGPRMASRRKCSTMASTVAADGNEAPA